MEPDADAAEGGLAMSERMRDGRPEVVLYALLTCAHCRRVKEYLEQRGVSFEIHHVDLLTGDDRSRALDALKRKNPACTFPTLVMGDQVVVGYRPDEIEKGLRELTTRRESHG